MNFFFNSLLRKYIPLIKTSKKRSAVILGSGPSLKGFDFKNFQDFDVFGMNSAYRYWEQIGWYPKYYSCLDSVVGADHKDAIEDMIERSQDLGIEFFLLRGDLISYLSPKQNADRIINFDLLKNDHPSLACEPITTGSHTMAWATILGYDKIFLLGIDCNYKEFVPGAKRVVGNVLQIEEEDENPNYFFEGYQKKGDKYNIPNPSRGLHTKSWGHVRKLIPDNVSIINANPRSALSFFPFISPELVFSREYNTENQPSHYAISSSIGQIYLDDATCKALAGSLTPNTRLKFNLVTSKSTLEKQFKTLDLEYIEAPETESVGSNPPPERDEIIGRSTLYRICLSRALSTEDLLLFWTLNKPIWGWGLQNNRFIEGDKESELAFARNQLSFNQNVIWSPSLQDKTYTENLSSIEKKLLIYTFTAEDLKSFWKTNPGLRTWGLKTSQFTDCSKETELAFAKEQLENNKVVKWGSPLQKEVATDSVSIEERTQLGLTFSIYDLSFFKALNSHVWAWGVKESKFIEGDTDSELEFAKNQLIYNPNTIWNAKFQNTVITSNLSDVERAQLSLSLNIEDINEFWRINPTFRPWAIKEGKFQDGHIEAELEYARKLLKYNKSAKWFQPAHKTATAT